MGARGFIFFIRNYYGRIKFNYNNMNGLNRNQRGKTQNETGKKIKNYLYHYSDMIGKGNFAKVFKGTNMTTEQTVAIKMISLDELKSRHLEQLVFEQIRILQMLKHPNVLDFIEALLSERNCYIITELCRDGSLEDRIKTRVPFSEQQIGRIILDVWQGLKYMRQKNVAHRDIKPANIFMSKGRAIIADFGLAKFYTYFLCYHSERFKDLDIGSPQYMSPEGVILNCYSQKTDIWAFGITIYQMLHGNSPFQFCKRQNDLKYYVNRPIPDSWWRRDINPLLKQFILKCLQIDEYKRPNIFQLANEPYLRSLLHKGNDLIQQNRVNHNFLQRQVPLQMIKTRTQDKPQVQNKGPRPTSMRQMSGDRDSPDVKYRGQTQHEIPSSKKFDFRNQLLRVSLNGNGEGPGQQKIAIHSSFTKKDREEPRSHNPSPSVFSSSHTPFQYQIQSNNNVTLGPKAFTDRNAQERLRTEYYNHQYNSMRPGTPSTDIRRELCDKTSQTNESEDERRYNNRVPYNVKRHL